MASENNFSVGQELLVCAYRPLFTFRGQKSIDGPWKSYLPMCYRTRRYR